MKSALPTRPTGVVSEASLTIQDLAASVKPAGRNRRHIRRRKGQIELNSHEWFATLCGHSRSSVLQNTGVGDRNATLCDESPCSRRSQ
jgi:hypothetical protein